MSEAPPNQVQQFSPAQAQDSEERYRALFLQEQNRARHLSLINEVQKCALMTRDPDSFLQQVARAIQSHFSDSDVVIHRCVPKVEFGVQSAENACDLVAAARAGDHGFGGSAGERHHDSSMAGRAVRSQRTQHLEPGQDDAEQNRGVQSGMCVPVIASGHTLGVVCMESPRADAIGARDAVALQTAAAIIASHLESGRLFEEMRELSAFNQTLITTMLHALMAADRDGNITLVNARLCQTLGLMREDLLGQPIERVFGEGVACSEDLRTAIIDVAESGTPYELPEVQIQSPDGRQVFDVRLFRVYFRGEAQAIVLLINITRRWRNFRQLQLVNEIGRLFGASLDINEVLHTVLTCVTAGAGLGFNRAFLLLRDEDTSTLGGTLSGAMALGPSSSDEAMAIWSELGSQDLSLEQILENSAQLDSENLTPLQEQTLDLEITIGNPCFPALTQAVEERRAMRVRRDDLIGLMSEMLDAGCGRQREKARLLLTAPEIAIAPLLAKDRVVGVILADNLYSGAPIEPDDVQLLDALAQQAGLTVANALAYQALQSAQRELVGAERLAAVGEMAARVSHEIRNPLATVGGFARSISKAPQDADGVARKTRIIVDEVARLEELLNDLVDMARPRALDLQPHPINSIVEHALLLADADITAHKVQVEKEFDEDLPPTICDRARVLQAVLNIIRNGAQAMAEGGELLVTTRRSSDLQYVQVEVKDSGVGISGQALKHVFDPFFSTKLKGSGLGLAITRRIVQDHGGEIDAYSEPGEGTTFVLNWPLRERDQPEV